MHVRNLAAQAGWRLSFQAFLSQVCWTQKCLRSLLTPGSRAFIWSLSGGLCGSALLTVALPVSAVELAQVHSANHACYLHDREGVQYDLSALCTTSEASSAVVLQTGDVQVTLRWNTPDDVDLYVQDPAGDQVFYGNPSVPSGGQLDVDANLGCAEQMASPVENIFWPTGGGVPGDYVVTVNLFSFCGPPGPIDFTLTTLVRGETQNYTGTLSQGQESMSFPFTFGQ